MNPDRRSLLLRSLAALGGLACIAKSKAQQATAPPAQPFGMIPDAGDLSSGGGSSVVGELNGRKRIYHYDQFGRVRWMRETASSEWRTSTYSYRSH